MKVAFVGSRSWPWAKMVVDEVIKLEKHDIVVSGGAHGVDTFAENAARKLGHEVIVYEPDWKAHGRKAGFLRNMDIVKEANRMIAFSYENSKGTQHSINLAKKKGIPVKLISYTKAHGLQVSSL